MTLHSCPVCRQRVRKTRNDNIAAHLDSIQRDMCDGTGHPYRITIKPIRARTEE